MYFSSHEEFFSCYLCPTYSLVWHFVVIGVGPNRRCPRRHPLAGVPDETIVYQHLWFRKEGNTILNHARNEKGNGISVRFWREFSLKRKKRKVKLRPIRNRELITMLPRTEHWIQAWVLELAHPKFRPLVFLPESKEYGSNGECLWFLSHLNLIIENLPHSDQLVHPGCCVLLVQAGTAN